MTTSLVHVCACVSVCVFVYVCVCSFASKRGHIKPVLLAGRQDHIIIVAESRAEDGSSEGSGSATIVGVINVGIKSVSFDGAEMHVGFVYGLRVHEAVQSAGAYIKSFILSSAFLSPPLSLFASTVRWL